MTLSSIDSHNSDAAPKKIDLTARYSKPSSSQQRSQSDSVDIDPTFPSRTTALNGIVASKPSSTILGPSRQKKSSKSDDGSIKSAALHGGMSDEDDSLEKEQAMSSPMKGSELRATKVIYLYCVAQS
jgi:hypothetical protein